MLSRLVTRRARRGFVVLALAALVLLALGLAARALERRVAAAVTRERIEAGLGAALGRAVTVDRIVLRRWFAGVTVEGVRVAAGPGWEAGTLVSLGRLDASVGLRSLWRGELVLSSVRLQDVDLRLGGGTGGDTLTLPDRIPDRVALGPVVAVIAQVEVARARLTLARHGGAPALVVEGLGGRARPRDGGLDLALAASRAVLAEPAVVLDTLTAEGRLQGSSVEIAALRARWEGETLDVAGSVRRIDSAPALDVRARGRVAVAPVARVLGSGLPLRGLATIDLRLTGSAGAPEIAGRAAIANFTAGPAAARTIAGTVDWSAGTFRARDVVAQTLGGEVRGAFELDASLGARVTARWRGVALREVEPLLGVATGITGTLSGEGEVRGDVRRLLEGQGGLRVESTDLTLPGELRRLGPANVRVTGRFARGGVEIADGGAHWATARVERVSGLALPEGPRTLRAAITADAGRLLALLGETRVAGNATVDVELGGRWAAPAIDGRLRAATLSVMGGRVDAVDVPFTLRAATLGVRDASATLGASRLGLTGVAQASSLAALAAAGPDVRFDADVHAPSARAEDLRAVAGAAWPIAGRFAMTARVAGTRQAWRASGRVEAPAVEIAGRHVERLTATVTADTRGLEATAVGATIAGTRVDGAGTWRWDGSGTARADLGPLTLHGVALGRGRIDLTVAAWRMSATLALRERGITATGEGMLAAGQPFSARAAFRDLDLTGAVRGFGKGAERVELVKVSGQAEMTMPLGDPGQARGTVQLEPARLTVAGQDWAARGPVVLRRQPGVTRIERLTLEGRTGTVTASGTIDDALRLDVALQGELPLAVLPALRAEVAEASGTVETTGRVTGTVAAPEITGEATVRGARLTLRRVPQYPLTALNARLALAGRRIQVVQASATIAGAEVRATGEVLLQAPAARLDLRVQGKVPMAMVATLRPEVREAGGVIALEARVAGTVAEPQVAGDGTLTDGWVALRDYPVPLHDIRGRFNATPQRVRVLELTALLGGGEIRASGDVGLQAGGVGAYRLKVQARRVGVESVERLSTTWDADLEVVGLGARGQVRGEAHLLHGSYVDESSVLRLLLGSRARGSGGSTAGALGIDLRVHLGDNLVVRTAVTRFRAGGDLKVQGTTAAPVLFGTVEVRDGFLLFQRQRFTLTSASARFVDPRRIDPIVDVEAAARIQGYDVTVRMKGRVEDLEIRLASSPPLPQDDLLSLVAFGQTAAQLGKSGAGTVAGEAVALVVQELFGVRTASALDVLEVDTSDASSRAVKVGKRINEKTLVVYSQGVDRWDERKLRVEYQVAGPLAVAGEQDFRGGFGADVLLRLRFR